MKHVSFDISNNWEDYKDLQVAVPWISARPNSRHILFKARMNKQWWLVRMNDFPDEPAMTLVIDQDEIMHFDDWPPFWGKRPEFPVSLKKKD